MRTKGNIVHEEKQACNWYITILDINDCATDPCQNGATCKDEVGRYTCICVPGHTGVLCETGILSSVAFQCLLIW